MVSSLVLAPLLAATSVWAVTNQGTPCLNACSKWSETLSFCYDSFGLSPSIYGYDYANQFLACLCEGKNINGAYGNFTMTQSAGICQSCSTTPKEIKANLMTYLNLCAIQSQNGTSSEALTFAPLGYITANSPNVGITAVHHNAAAAAATPTAISLVAILAGTAVALAAIA